MKRFMTTMAAIGLSIATSSSAFAVLGYTGVNTGSTFGGGVGTPSNESGSPKSIVDIMKDTYGGTASGTITTSIVLSSGVTLTRVADTGGSGNQMLNGTTSTTADDNLWQDGSVGVLATAKYAAFSQGFGYNKGSDVQLLASPTTPGNTASTFIGAGTFKWFRNGGGQLWYSDSASNSPAEDHMVTFKVTKTADGSAFAGAATFMLFFEDLAFGSPSDKDYNDLAVQITAVPVPAAAWTGLLTLAGLGALTVIRRRKMA